MKIVRVTVLAFHRQLDGRAWNPAFRWRERQAPLVVVETADGVQGIGEGWSRYTDCRSVLDELSRVVAPLAAGCEIAHPRDAAAGLCAALPADDGWARAAAVSALDIALWDAWARTQQMPLWQALGGESADAPAYASGALYRDDYPLTALHDEIAGYRSRGFRHVKMKIGGVAWADDLARIATVRNALGPDGLLWVDGVNQLDSATSDDWIADLRCVNVAAIQSPVPFDDIDGMRRINASLPVIACEAAHRLAEFKALLQAQAVSHLQYCLTLCGGVSGGLALDEIAQAAGVTSTPQCFSTIVAQAVTLHFAAARRNVVSAEYHGFHDHLKSLAEQDLGAVHDGLASAGRGDGLGVRIPAAGVQDDGSMLTRVVQYNA
ncbi:mandelate racemase/muconate lactonizing enzyme family protein [Pandoraea communis]|uniref:Mandelate racemase/muconate lactonizing enzyme family protein n=1 Tax=Pandoraea communis TaxID=2508297 RepID=A0A5E4WYV2_9BURK|nr:mandelate racemase/muconate lactonizing enzyme family protein [Pandoraea communis]VVE28495.1 mandelate racemase/muconate lactonizing enzyme family protein [Pandoraea communis]